MFYRLAVSPDHEVQGWIWFHMEKRLLLELPRPHQSSFLVVRPQCPRVFRLEPGTKPRFKIFSLRKQLEIPQSVHPSCFARRHTLSMTKFRGNDPTL